MLNWIKQFLYNLLSEFFGWIWDFFKSVVVTVVGYIVDLFVWLLEFVFWIFDSIVRFLWSLAEPLIIAALEAIAEHMPEGVVEAITASYSWLQYINEWVPVEYCITLFIAYYGIAVALYIARILISLIPFINAKV